MDETDFQDLVDVIFYSKYKTKKPTFSDSLEDE